MSNEEYWASHAEAGHRQMIVAQENLMRLMPDVFAEVVFLEFNDEDDAA